MPDFQPLRTSVAEIEPGMHPTVACAIRPKFIAGGVRYENLADALTACQELDLDETAINCFLRSGLFLDGRTPFRQIRRDVPSPVVVPSNSRPRRQAVAEYAELFRNAVGRRLTRDATLGLSGGADSRHILLELAHLGCLPADVITVDLPTSDDAALARELAQQLNLRHRIIQPGIDPDEEIRKCRAVGLMSLQHRWMMPLADHIGNGAWWDGIGGDVLSAGLFLERWNLELMQAGAFEAYAEKIVAPGPVPYFGDKGRYRREDAVHAVASELERHAESANPVGSFYFWNRTCVDIASAPFGILASRGVRILAPYLDAQVWEYLSSIPASTLVDHQFHVDTIHAAHPKFEGLRFAAKHPSSSALQRKHAKRLAAFAWKEFRAHPRWSAVTTLARALRSVLSARGDSSGQLSAWVFYETVTRIARTTGRTVQQQGTLATQMVSGRRE